MNILWVTSEAVPYAKTGGLADVSAALPLALAERGHHVSVVMPFYPQQMGKLNLKFNEVHELLRVPFGDGCEWARVNVLRTHENLTWYFIEYNRFFDRPKLYDWDGREYADNAQRYIFLCRAAMELAVNFRLAPDVLMPTTGTPRSAASTSAPPSIPATSSSAAPAPSSPFTTSDTRATSTREISTGPDSAGITSITSASNSTTA